MYTSHMSHIMVVKLLSVSCVPLRPIAHQNSKKPPFPRHFLILSQETEARLCSSRVLQIPQQKLDVNYYRPRLPLRLQKEKKKFTA